MLCIAVDDEPLALYLLQDYISKVPYLDLVATCGDAFEATKMLQEHAIDLVFTDIQMPGLTGLQFIKSMANPPMFILVTAYEKFALEGYRLNVVDYLVKPVQLEHFMQACNKALDMYQLKTKVREPAPQADKDFIFLNVDYSLVKILFEEISYAEGLRDYVKIHFKNGGKPIIARMSVSALADSLPPTKFIRFHKSYITSISSITSVRKNSVFIDTIELPIGSTYRDSITKLTGRDML